MELYKVRHIVECILLNCLLFLTSGVMMASLLYCLLTPAWLTRTSALLARASGRITPGLSILGGKKRLEVVLNFALLRSCRL